MLENKSIAQVKDTLNTAFAKGTLAGTWLISGPKGVGKATVALEMAGKVLGVALQGKDAVHPDLLYIERGLTETEKKEKAKLLNSGKELDIKEEAGRKRSQDITVDEVRNIGEFIRLSSVSGWKVIIVDVADDMNKNAANAILKVIEEPPANAAIFLIANNPSGLLPTILSRCRKLAIAPFATEEIAEVMLAKYGSEGLTAEDAGLIAGLAKGSVGLAMTYYEMDCHNTFKEMVELFKDFPKVPIVKAYDLAGRAEKNEEMYNSLKEMFIFWLYRIAKLTAEAGDFVPMCKGEQVAMKIAAGLGADRLFAIYDKVQKSYRDLESLYLDKKQVMVNAFLELKNAG